MMHPEMQSGLNLFNLKKVKLMMKEALSGKQPIMSKVTLVPETFKELKMQEKWRERYMMDGERRRKQNTDAKRRRRHIWLKLVPVTPGGGSALCSFRPHPLQVYIWSFVGVNSVAELDLLDVRYQSPGQVDPHHLKQTHRVHEQQHKPVKSAKKTTSRLAASIDPESLQMQFQYWYRDSTDTVAALIPYQYW